ncbi:MAG: YifB family Mg chelatase-like AAA ATPase [bacterium]
MLAKAYGATILGLSAHIVEVEADISPGLPAFNIVGLPDQAVKESRERVKAALLNSGYQFPDQRVTINLAPGDLRKEGALLDFPIAAAILAAMNIIPEKALKHCLLIGELTLAGEARPVNGALLISSAAAEAGFWGLILPEDNASEAAIVERVKVFGFPQLARAVRFLRRDEDLARHKVDLDGLFREPVEDILDYAEVKGQEFGKRGLEVAAAGGHNLIMIGPPGSGKTMLAKRLSTILPPLEREEAIETTKIHSVAGLLDSGKALLTARPFRSPHHSVSSIALIGGGSYPKPGEISLAHHGILFLDEIPEFPRNVLEVMRQPLEDGKITVSRAKATLNFPASFMLVASMNPCPCGYWGDRQKECRCSATQVRSYANRLSGPLLDRIDLHLEIPRIPYKEMSDKRAGESSETIRERVRNARRIQRNRHQDSFPYLNSQLNSKKIKKYCQLDREGSRLVESAIDNFGFSARGYNRILKVSRTIADLEGTPEIKSEHIGEAIGYRTLDRSA